MKINKFLILFICLSFTFIEVFSQNGDILIINNKTYKSTPTFSFQNTNETDCLDIVIAKKEKGGIIMLKLSQIMNIHCINIKGTIKIYLENGEIISCIDRKITDHVDKTASTIYYLTLLEIEKLKKSNIHSIRYTIKGNRYGCMSLRNNCTAVNNKTFCDLFPSTIKKTNVCELVKLLF